MLAFTLTVAASVWLVAWLVSESLSRTFAERDKHRTTQLAQQFKREFDRRGEELLQRVKAVAATPIVQTILNAPDPAPFVNEAEQLSNEQRLNYLEILSKDANIISSAEWPARFGYKEEWLHERNWGSSGSVPANRRIAGWPGAGTVRAEDGAKRCEPADDHRRVQARRAVLKGDRRAGGDAGNARPQESAARIDRHGHAAEGRRQQDARDRVYRAVEQGAGGLAGFHSTHCLDGWRQPAF